MTYVFDTNAYIAWWHQLYPPVPFPDIKALIQHDTQQQIIRSPVAVKKELEEKVEEPGKAEKKEKNSLAEWANEQSTLFIQEQYDQQDRIAQISNDYPQLVKQHVKHNADPTVIVLAEANQWTVVTQENPNKKVVVRIMK